MIAELHVAPDPAGSTERPYAVIEAAIAVIERSGLAYEVGALGTTFEGPDDAVWRVLRDAHEACLSAGADRVITSIRIAQWSESHLVSAAASGSAATPSISTLTEPFRSSAETDRGASVQGPGLGTDAPDGDGSGLGA